MTPQQAIEVKEFNKLCLVGTHSLVYKKVNVKSKVTFCRQKNGKRHIIEKELLERHSEILNVYPLMEVPKGIIATLRNSGTPGFILKTAGKYYYATVPSNINFIAQKMIKPGHQCSLNCKHLSPTPVEMGGCPKISEAEKHLEDFDFISVGYETFNCAKSFNAFCVGTCKCYEKEEPRKQLTMAQRRKISRDFFDCVEWYFEEKAKRTSHELL